MTTFVATGDSRVSWTLRLLSIFSQRVHADRTKLLRPHFSWTTWRSSNGHLRVWEWLSLMSCAMAEKQPGHSLQFACFPLQQPIRRLAYLPQTHTMNATQWVLNCYLPNRTCKLYHQLFRLHPRHHHVELSYLCPNQNIVNRRISPVPSVTIQPVQLGLAANIHTSHWLRLPDMIDEAQLKCTPSPPLSPAPS